MNDLNVNRQLLEDLNGMEDLFEKRGWVPGALFSWIPDLRRMLTGLRDREDKKKAAAAGGGAMCITGAAGAIAEGDEFVLEALSGGWSSGKEYAWTPRGKSLLECLVAHIPSKFLDRQLLPDSVAAFIRDNPDEPIPDGIIKSVHVHTLISAIIATNDSKLKATGDALKWVRTAKSWVEFEIDEQEAEMARQGVVEEPKMEFPALKRRIEHIKASPVTPEKAAKVTHGELA